MPKNIEKKLEEIDIKIDKTRERIKDSSDRDAYQRVFDSRTTFALQKLLNNGIINEIIGIISHGKEANIYFAYANEQKPVAIKIYKISSQNSKWMEDYVKGDPRFKRIGTSTDKVIFNWCQKEYRNLSLIKNNGIKCPEPIFYKLNILIMEYIGLEDGTPAKKLKDSISELKNPEEEFNISIGFIKDMFLKAKLVHADLSEFNILYFKNQQYVIDVSQSISIEHPKALYFLIRDIKNIINFYRNFNIKTPEIKDIYDEIVGT